MFTATMSFIALGTADPQNLGQYYRDILGMAEHGMVDDRHRYGWGRGHHAVEFVAGPHGLDRFGFEVHGEEALSQLAARFDANGIPFTLTPGAGAEPESLSVEDPDGNRVAFHGGIDRSGEFIAGRRPDRIQHIALSTRSTAALVDFYAGVVGFRVSDRMGDDKFVWLRSDHFHHSLAFIERDTAGLDHFSFDVTGWDKFRMWCDHLSRHDTLVLWGPGRHGPGNNTFIMFRDPDGYLIEYSDEMELYWDDVTVQAERRWENVGKTASLWGAWPAFRQEESTLNASR